jgi:molybdate transport system substrate-binding protein
MASISGISSMATRQLLADLARVYQSRVGQVVRFESVGGVDAARRVQAGEAFDIVVLASHAIQELESEGHLKPRSAADLVRSGVAVAVPAGTPKPALATQDDVRSAVLAASSIGVSTGPSGVQLQRLFERWGIVDQIRDRVVQAAPGVPVGTLVACGEVALGFQQLSELIHVAGIDIVGPLPPAIQIDTVFSAAVGARSAHPQEAAACIAFMASPDAADAKRRQGMEPA